jgi:hypothetical protein
MQVARFEDRALTLMKGASFDEIKAKLTEETNFGRKGRKPKLIPMQETKLDKLAAGASRYMLSLKKIQTLLMSLQGYKDFGAWTDLFDKSVHEAANIESKLMSDDAKGLDAAFSVYSKTEKDELMNKRVYYPELGASVTKIKLIEMAFNLGNEDNKQKLFQNKPVGIEEAAAWNEQVAMDLLQKHLSAKDFKFVQSIWKIMEAKWVHIAALNKELTGFTPGKVAAVPFNVKTSDGQYLTFEGGYFPLKQDSRVNIRAAEYEDLDSPLYTEQNPGWRAATKQGHTIGRTGAQYKVALDHMIVFKHLRDVNHDIAFRKVVIDLSRLVADKEIQGLVTSVLGLDGYREISNWVKAVAGDQSTPSDTFARVAAGLRSRTVVAALAMRVGVITQNLANVFLYAGAAEGFGKKEVVAGFLNHGLPYWSSAVSNRNAYTEQRAFVFSQSQFMADKHSAPDFSLVEVKRKGLGENTKMQDIVEFSGGLMAGTDELTGIPMWMAAYRHGLDTKFMEQDEAIYYADTVIKKTLGSGRRVDTASIQRSTELGKLVSMFYSFLNTEYNRWAQETGKAQIDPKYRMRYAGFVMSRLIVFNSFSLLLSGKSPGEDDDAVNWWVKQTLGYPLSFFPGARDVASVALDTMLGLHSFGYRASPATGAFDAGIRLVQTLASDEAEKQKVAESIAKTMSYAVPYPDQMNAWFFNAYDTMFNRTGFKPKDVFSRRPEKER